MVRCGVKSDIYCEYRRKGNCENAQDPCPVDKEGGKVKALVPFTYLAEVEMDREGKTVSDIKHQAISLAIKKFTEEFAGENLLDIAHSLAPAELSKVSLDFRKR